MSNIQYIKGQPVALGKDTVIQPLPVQGMDQHSPFLLIHHFGPESMGPEKRNFRVPPHPHRGFQPVTLVFSGIVRHKDSLGNDSSIGPGGVQWISAARGIIHSEEADPAFIEKGGKLELIQLWINVPASKKMLPAEYIGLSADQIPEFKADGEGTVRVFGGKWKDVQGAIEPKTPLTVAIWEAESGDKIEFDTQPGWNSMAYVVSGKISAEGESNVIGQYEAVTWTTDQENIRLGAEAKSRLLLLTGKPIEEPVSQYGPFVMNTQTEIMQAIRDFNMGKMGVLID